MLMHTPVPTDETPDAGTSFVVRRRGQWRIDWSEKRTNWIGNSAILDAVQALANQCAGRLVLDVGAGNMPYRGVLAEQGCSYESLDWPSSIHVRGGRHTYYAEADQIPVSDARFDVVLCTEVLEHLTNPRQTLEEFCRVLKPGGILLLTVPFLHGEHETPHDHYRFTRYCLAKLLDEAGFEVERLESRSELIGTILVLNNQWLNLFWKRGSRKLRMRWLNSIYNPLIFLPMIVPQWICRRIFRHRPAGGWRDRWWQLTEGWTSGFVVRAIRRDTAQQETDNIASGPV